MMAAGMVQSRTAEELYDVVNEPDQMINLIWPGILIVSKYWSRCAKNWMPG